MKTKQIPATTLRVRISPKDIHYNEGITSGAKVMELFGDAATELLIRTEGCEGLFRAYQGVEFLAPVRSGDFLEVTATLLAKGKTSREMTFEAYKVIEGGMRVLSKPILVARARGTCVIKRSRKHEAGKSCLLFPASCIRMGRV